jgi:autotransporter-associated beta strand protein
MKTPIRRFLALAFAAALVSGLAHRAHAASHTWSGAVDGYWSTPGNWSVGGVPTLAETNSLSFPAGAVRTTITNDIGALKLLSMSLSGNGYVVRGAATLTFMPNLFTILTGLGTSNTVESPLHFQTVAYVSLNSGASLVLSGALSGTNDFIKASTGNLYFKGAASNPLSGELFVDSGELHFQKTGGATPYNGNRIRIGTTNVTDPTQLFLYANNSIPDGADLDIQPSGALVMNNFSDNVNSVSMYSGIVDAGTGTLGINSSLNLTARQVSGSTWESPTLNGKIEFHGAACTISANSNTCNLAASIVENGTATVLNKTGSGTLVIQGTANNYTGALNVQQGRVVAGHSTALGTTAGATTVSSGATLQVGTGVTSAEPLSLAGLGNDGQGALQLNGASATFTGGVTLTGETGIGVLNANGILNLDGAISGAGGIRKLGDGALSLNGFGNNSFSGASFVAGGKLILNKSANVRALGSVTVTNGAELVFNANEQMDNAGVLSIYSGAVVNMLNRSETLGGLNIGSTNTLDLGTGTLTLQGNAFVGPPYSTGGAFPAVLRGAVSLGGAIRSVTTTNGGSLMFDGPVSDGAGTGGLNVNGSFWLMRSNSFSGPVVVSGFCYASNSWAFGASGGGVWSTNLGEFGNELFLLDPVMAVTAETLTLGVPTELRPYGPSNAWNGPISMIHSGSLSCLGTLGSDLTLGGSISGTNTANGIIIAGLGITRLKGTNSYEGWTDVYSSTLAIHNAQALGSTNGGTGMLEGGRLRLELPDGAVISNEWLYFHFLLGGGFPTYEDRLVVAGAVTNTWRGPVTLNTGAGGINVEHFQGRLILDAPVVGGGGVIKTGFGSLVLSGMTANTFTGDTEVRDGYLHLNKPNGVQAVTNLVLTFDAHAVWLASEQIPDGARLFVGTICSATLGTNAETITQLDLDSGYVAGTGPGALKLLGDIGVTTVDPMFPNSSSIACPLLLSAGSHRVVNVNPAGAARIDFAAPVRDLTTNGGLSFSNVNVSLPLFAVVTNTFSGPVTLSAGQLTMGNKHGLGSPAQGVTMDQASALYLDLPHGDVVEGESLTVIYDDNQFGTGARMGTQFGVNATNGWSGPILNQQGLYLVGPPNWGLDLSGPITGNGDLDSFLQGTLILSGTESNTFDTLHVNDGEARLAKTGGAQAVRLQLGVGGYTNTTPEVHIDGPGQLNPTIAVYLHSSALYLHDHPTTIGYLYAGVYSSIYCGANPASALTISNNFSTSEFIGDFNGTLIKQGSGGASFSGNFQNGDLFIQGGTFNRASLGAAGQTFIAPGAVVNSSGAQLFNFGALSGGGTLNIAGNTTWLGGGSGAGSTFTGPIVGTNAGTLLTKLGSGAQTLAGPVSLVATTLVQNGTLLVNGAMPNSVLVTPLAPGNQPTLGGTGTVGNVTLTGLGARLSPGPTTASPSYGRLRVNNLTLGTGAHYRGEIGGTNAGVNLDQIETLGSTTLAGGFADFAAFGTGVLSNRYVVVKAANPVSGTFLNDPEGDTYAFGAGRTMTLTYLPNGGRDITLIEQPNPVPNIGGIERGENGNMTITGTGLSGALYDIQSNTNLNTTNWIVIGTVTGDINGAISFTDTNAIFHPMRYFRFVLP